MKLKVIEMIASTQDEGFLMDVLRKIEARDAEISNRAF